MVDFKGLNDSVSTLEKEIVTLTSDLENVKKELERVKKEYHDEANPDNKGIREFLLEKAEKWKEKNWENNRGQTVFRWKSAEDAPDELARMSDATKRKVNKKSVILVCDCNGAYEQLNASFYFCDEKVVILNLGKVIIVDYDDVTDINKVDFGCNVELAIHTSHQVYKIFLDSNTDFTTQGVLYSLLWDVYEFVNG